jgi:hypothetical protein
VSDDPRAAIADALGEPGPTTPLRVLRAAANWGAGTVLVDACADDLVALECVIALDDAMPQLAALIGQAPQLVKLAAPGGDVADRLAAVGADLIRAQSALAADRAALAAGSDVLTRLAEVEAERDRLRADLDRLERARLIERELPALRDRLAELTSSLSQTQAEPYLEAPADEVIGGLVAAARRLLALTEEQRSLLDVGNDGLLNSVEAAATAAAQALARRDEIAAELQTRQDEAAELRLEGDRTLPALRAIRQADEELAAGIALSGLPGTTPADAAEDLPPSPLARVRGELAEIGRRLDGAEGVLRPLLRQHLRAYQEATKVRGLTEG